MARRSARGGDRWWCLALLLTFAPLPARADAPRLTGFTAAKSAWQRQYEALLKELPSPAECRKNSLALSEHPSLVGSDWDRANVHDSVEQLRAYGLHPQVFTYDVYLSVPAAIEVELVWPDRYTARTKENGWPWQQHLEDVVVGYNAYSPPGDVTADLVYVNYGVPEDYDTLAAHGVDVRGKIAIARYGKVFRGVKNKVAEEHGAVGLILFSDPADDGFVLGPVYPDGPWRPADGIQRGTTMWLFEYPGDPLTPGWASTPNAHRLEPARAGSLPHVVPTTPLAYGEAAPLLAAIGGDPAPAAWQGGLPFTYHLGPGPAKVHMRLDIRYERRPIWNVLVSIPGSRFPDQWVVLGAHRDGWTYGTNDSNAGYVVVMETARALAALLREGWQPERTIVLAGWDGEEYGMLGSTEWAEEFQHVLERNAVAYLDLDSAGGGSYFTAAGVPSLDRFVREVTQEVEEPRTPGTSVYQDWVERYRGTHPGAAVAPLDRLGGGYDYQVWIDRLGIPTIQMCFDYIESGNYHSAYDDLYFLERWGDPGYQHHAAMAKLAGIAALRLANADVLPFEYSAYASEVSRYLDALHAPFPGDAASDPTNLKREADQARAWGSAAQRLERRAESLLTATPSLAPDAANRVATLNDGLMRLERDLTQPKGLPGRPWFKHVIYAPGLYTGYGVQTLAALQESMEAGDWAKVRSYRALLHDSLTRATSTTSNAAGR